MGLFYSKSATVDRDKAESRRDTKTKEREELVRKFLATRSIHLSVALKMGNPNLTQKIEANIDLVSPFPLDLMTPGGEELRHTKKSYTVSLVQGVLQSRKQNDTESIDSCWMGNPLWVLESLWWRLLR